MMMRLATIAVFNGQGDAGAIIAQYPIPSGLSSRRPIRHWLTTLCSLQARSVLCDGADATLGRSIPTFSQRCPSNALAGDGTKIVVIIKASFPGYILAWDRPMRASPRHAIGFYVPTKAFWEGRKDRAALPSECRLWRYIRLPGIDQLCQI